VKIFSEAPRLSVSRERLAQPLSLVELVAIAKLVPSRAEGKRTIQNGGLYLNGSRLLSK
jgi:tyrosyl-tRNA synthetase